MSKQKSLLTPQDFENIRLIVREEVAAEVGSQLDEKVGNLPTKDQYYSTMDNLMKEIKGARSDLAAHGMSHENIKEDTSKLKQQVNHIFKTFEINDPTEVVPSY